MALFRNLWFLCVLFRFTSLGEKGSATSDWQVAALSRIAAKTPALVVEEIPDFLTSNLEYNTIIRQEYAQTVSEFMLFRKFSCVDCGGYIDRPLHDTRCFCSDIFH